MSMKRTVKLLVVIVILELLFSTAHGIKVVTNVNRHG